MTLICSHVICFLYVCFIRSALADVFIALVDDWNHEGVAAGTKEAFAELGFKVAYGEVLGGGYTSGAKFTNPWHNGLYLAVVEKQR